MGLEIAWKMWIAWTDHFCRENWWEASYFYCCCLYSKHLLLLFNFCLVVQNMSELENQLVALLEQCVRMHQSTKKTQKNQKFINILRLFGHRSSALAVPVRCIANVEKKAEILPNLPALCTNLLTFHWSGVIARSLHCVREHRHSALTSYPQVSGEGMWPHRCRCGSLHRAAVTAS